MALIPIQDIQNLPTKPGALGERASSGNVAQGATLDSAIGWTGLTWNPWKGCKKVSAGCKNCYMFRDMKRYGQDPAVVMRTKKDAFNKPLKAQKEVDRGERTGVRRLVFTCSWSDFFIDQADAWRADAWEVIRQTPGLVYQILTKRPERIADHLPPFWDEIKDRIWIGATVEYGKHYDRLVTISKIDAGKRFASFEPLVGSVTAGTLPEGYTLSHRTGLHHITNEAVFYYPIDWAIIGGESGGGGFDARPMARRWVMELISACKADSVDIFFKQWGDWVPIDLLDYDRASGSIEGKVVDRLKLAHYGNGEVFHGVAYVPFYDRDPLYWAKHPDSHLYKLGYKKSKALDRPIYPVSEGDRWANGTMSRQIFSPLSDVSTVRQIPPLPEYTPRGS